MRTLRRYLTGNDVRYFQYLSVSEYGQKIAMDGSFGDGTFAAAKNVQEMLGFKGKEIDGSIGPATQARMGMTDFIVHIYDRKDVWFAGTPYGSKEYPLRTLKQWATLEGADRVYNLAFFAMTEGTDKYGTIKGRTVNYVKAQGKDLGYGGVPQRMTVNPGNICGGYKVGIENGRKQSVSSWGARSRNANGRLKDGRYFQAQSIYTVTEKALVDFMANNYDVDLLLFQDGGGSTGFYDRTRDALIAPEKEGTNGRPVASVVCVKVSQAEPQVRYCPTCGQEWR